MSTGCWKCGAPKVVGRLNCLQCGSVYRDASERTFERDPAKHRFEHENAVEHRVSTVDTMPRRTDL